MYLYGRACTRTGTRIEAKDMKQEYIIIKICHFVLNNRERECLVRGGGVAKRYF